MSGCKRRESSFADKTVPDRLHRFPDRLAAVLGSQAKEDDGVIGVGARSNDRIRMQQDKLAGKAVGGDIASEQPPFLFERNGNAAEIDGQLSFLGEVLAQAAIIIEQVALQLFGGDARFAFNPPEADIRKKSGELSSLNAGVNSRSASPL